MPSARIRKKGSGCLSRNICSLCIGTYDALLWRTPMPRTLRRRHLRVYRSFSSLRDTKAFAAWIYRIATNEAMRIVEARKNADTDIDSHADMLAADSYVDYSDAEAVKLQNAILRLPPRQQVVFNLRYYNEMGYDDIAKVVDSTAAAAKTNYHLAKEKIIEYMTSNE